MSERIEKAAEELERLKAECQEWLRIGEKVPIPEEYRDTVATLAREVEAIVCAMQAHSHALLGAKEKMWEFICEVLPDGIGGKYELSFNSETFMATILGRKEE